MPSWQVEPARVDGKWHGYRQAAPDTAPLYHAAGEQTPSQRSGRWHSLGRSYAQYLSLEASGAWAELIRYERIRANARAAQYTRRLWLIYVEETDIADLSTFDRWEDCGLDPRSSVADHGPCQALADELLSAGYRGVLSPSAALPEAVNLTLFGERYEKVLQTRPEAWRNPQPRLWLPCHLVAEAGPPSQLLTQTCYVGMPHSGYHEHLKRQGPAESGPRLGPPSD